jgi:hypothetical protein
MTSIRHIILLSLVAIILIGCDESTLPNEYSNRIVVSAFLFAERPIDSVFVTRTANLLEYDSPNKYAVTNATVKITLVDTLDPSANRTYTLIPA